MLGFSFYVVRQETADRTQPAAFDTSQGRIVANWVSFVYGEEKLTALLPPDSIIALGGDGYPSRMTARAGELLPALRRGGAPDPKRGGDDRVTFYEVVAADCDDNEWLIIEMWDQS